MAKKNLGTKRPLYRLTADAHSTIRRACPAFFFKKIYRGDATRGVTTAMCDEVKPPQPPAGAGGGGPDRPQTWRYCHCLTHQSAVRHERAGRCKPCHAAWGFSSLS